MNDNKNKYPIGEMSQTASSSSLKVDELVEKKRNQKKSLIKLGAMGVLIAVTIIIGSLSWFTANRAVETSGMGVKTTGAPFELKAEGTDILYTTRLGEVAAEYVDGETVTEGKMTAGGKCAIQWVMTSQNNMNNVRKSGDVTELSDITKLESDKYGLGPGSYGTLQFTVVPTDKTTTLDLEFKTLVAAYVAEYDEYGLENIETSLTPVEDVDINGYLKGHILFFYESTEEVAGEQTTVLHLIEDNDFTFSVTNDTTITLRWVWPETLHDILAADIEGIDPLSSLEVRNYMFSEPAHFLLRYDTPAEGEAAFGDMSIDLTDEENLETNISSVSARINNSTKLYDKYSSWYNNADQMIGDEISYITFELEADIDQ
ncbi:hypothetical protein [Ruminococcus flavefaciens]|uniref:hypothetical protein n=1 Tax=Ruminococcus flavefaciens TaxID=1265 RepID=UPI0026EF3A64|nr:hypothetical protein [Ruminococcus flavefaciens]